MKTFTTYAEKKAKQFLNLLQGYTKSIRITAILILLLMGVSNAWAGATWIGNSYIVANGTWYNASGTGQTAGAFHDKNLGSITSLTLGGEIQTYGQTSGTSNPAKMHYQISGKNAAYITLYWFKYQNNNNFFHSNGNGSTLQNNTFASKTIDISSLTPGDYTLSVWFEQPDGSQWDSNNSNNYVASFTIDPVVTFKANGGTGSDYTQTVKYNTSTALTANKFTRTGYSFNGWKTAANSGTSYANQASVKFTANTTLYAQWTANKYTITWNANGGTVDPTSSTYTYDGDEIPMPTPTRTGCTFNGWFTESTGVEPVSDVGKTNKPTSDVTYYAQWTIPAPTTDHTATRVYEEETINGWIADGDGAQATPYKFYNDETVRLTVTPLIEVAGLTAYYKVGETEQTANTFDLTNITTEVTPITITTYYKDSYGNNGPKATTTVYFQQVLTPELVLITNPATEISLGSIQDGNAITLSYSATYNGYSGSVTITQDQIIGNTTTTTTLTTTREDKYTYTYTNTSLNSPCIIAFTAQTTEQHGRIFKAHTEVAVYKNVTIKVNDTNGVMNKVYMWRGGDSEAADVKTEWPGESFLQEFGTWHVFTVKYPYYDHFVLNNGSNDNQTFDYVIPDEDKCYQLSDNKTTIDGYTNYTLTKTDCPGNLIVNGIKDSYEVIKGEEIVIVPSITLGLGFNSEDIKTTISTTGSFATATKLGTNLLISGNTVGGPQQFTVTYQLQDETPISFTFNVTVVSDNKITIQVKVPTTFDDDDNQYLWKNTGNVYIHYWWGDFIGDVNMTYLATVDDQYRFQARVPLGNTGKINFLVYYEYIDGGNRWRQTNDVTEVDKNGCYTLWRNGNDYKRGISRDRDDCWTENDHAYYQVKIYMGSGKTYTSNTVSDASETLSFFAPGKNETGYRAGAVMLYYNNKMVATIAPAKFETSGVYTANLHDTKNDITNVAPYTGDYYVRTYGNNDWGQNTYQQWSDDQRSQRIFTYFVPREEELYNHYWVDDLEYYSGGKDVSGYVANIYNNDLAGKLVTDHTGTTDENGKIYYGSSKVANVRFGYDPRTNYFCRAILKGSSKNDDFLNLYCATAYQDEGCTELVNNGTLKDSKLDDASNWVYEKEFYVPITNSNPTASVYLSATAYNSARNLLLGYEVDEITGEEDVNRPKQRTIIGSGTVNGTYHMRIIYDFKTNRLITAWEPQDGITFSEETTIHSDVLIIRHENNAAPQINLTNAGKVKSLETMYFALEFDRGSENASERHQEQYWFTLPFNCRVGEISGVPGYMQTWGIQRYRGDLRAQKGWFAETPTFWEWLSPNDILEAGEGYLLVFDKKAASWAEVEVRNDDGKGTKTRSILRLYFPSTTSGFDLQQQSTEHLTRTYENHTCTITTANRYLQDSNWKVIGTTSYNNAGITGYTKDDNPKYDELSEAPSFRYKYEYTMSNDNTSFWYRYTPENGQTATYQSFFGYMVQFAGTINWQPIMSETVPEHIAARRYVPANERTSFTTRLEIADAANKMQDQAFIALDEKATVGFDQNKDLSKVINRGANIYTLVEGIPFAGNTLPMEKVTVPVGVMIATAGTYTFRMPDGTDGIAVTLVDNVTGTHTNMLMSEYTITLDAGTIENRFYLVVDPDRTATSVENIGEEAKGDKAKDVEKFLIDGKLFIRTADGIFDAKGQRM